MTKLTILQSGALSTIQDLGRKGVAAMGVGQAGAADRGSYDLANRLAGNLPGAACIEATMGGLAFTSDQALLIVVTGATVPITVDGRSEAMNSQIHLAAGSEVRIGTPRQGVRSYVAVRGGIDAPRALGSRSCDTLGQIGPPPLEAGQSLLVAEEAGRFPLVSHAPVAEVGGGPVSIEYTLGPRDDWFTAMAISDLESALWTATDCNRVGARLAGPPLERRITDELPSEGTPLGGIQVPPSGPIILMQDRPLTGGYPMIGVVSRRSLDAVAQLRPGESVRFRRVLGSR